MAAVWAADGGGGPAGPDRLAALVEAAAGGVGVLATCVTAVDDRACRATRTLSVNSLPTSANACPNVTGAAGEGGADRVVERVVLTNVAPLPGGLVSCPGRVGARLAARGPMGGGAVGNSRGAGPGL